MTYNMNKITKSFSTFILFSRFSVSCHTHTLIVLMSLPSNFPFSFPVQLIHSFLSSLSTVSFILIKCECLHESTVLYIDLFLVFVCVCVCLKLCICFIRHCKLMQHCHHVVTAPSQHQTQHASCFLQVWSKLERQYTMFRRCFIRSVSVSMEATNSQNKIQSKYHFCVCAVCVCLLQMRATW